MRILRAGLMLAALGRTLTAQPSSEIRSAVVVFGPLAPQSSTSGIEAATTFSSKWVSVASSTLEIRFSGSTDTQEVTKFSKPDDVRRGFAYAAKKGVEGGIKEFLNSLDRASFTLKRHTGKRLLIAVVDAPLDSDDVQSRLTQTVEFCKESGINVLVFAPTPDSKLGSALESLASATGGKVVNDGASLEATASALAPAPSAATRSDDLRTRSDDAGAGLALHAAVIRTLPMKARGLGNELGPMHGLLVVESPLSGLEFQTNGGGYLARARISVIIRNASDKQVWEAKKEIAIKGPLKKLPLRRSGDLCYLREVQLPGGRYEIDATIEDLLAAKSGKISEPFTASDSAPGFDVSDAMVVRVMDDSVDKFEADQTLVFEGKALTPLLSPVFPARQAFDFQLYFIIYPDLRGAKPDMNMEILRDGQTVGRSHLAFNDEIRNTTTEGGALDAKGEQKSEFPYLAHIPNLELDPGHYTARVSVRQGQKTLVREAPFILAPQAR